LKITASALTIRPGESIELQAEASDTEGDRLAYSWEFSDGSFGGNLAEISTSWSQRGTYQARCTVCDMKGGTADDTVITIVR
jgi:hypothetical protein